MASAGSNDWQSQPRDPETGRFKERQGDYFPRDKEIKLRLTARERNLIAEAAASADQTMTSWIIAACEAHRRPQPPTEPEKGVLMGAWELLERLSGARG